MKQGKIQKLIENRTAFGGDDSELSVYDTYQQASAVELKFSNPTICTMITGKKLMSLPAASPFAFLPGESLIIPSNQLSHIDFPDAQLTVPTTCISIEIERSKLAGIVEKFNETASRSTDSGEWKYNDQQHFHFKNTGLLTQLITKLTHSFMESSPYRDMLIDLGIVELVIRVLQMNAQKLLIQNSAQQVTTNGLAAAIQYIKENPWEKIAVEQLASIACMSQAKFFRYFRNEFGLTPSQFIHQVKIKKACELLRSPRYSITDVCFELGYSNVSHFIRHFKNQMSMTPKKFQQAAILKSLVSPLNPLPTAKG